MNFSFSTMAAFAGMYVIVGLVLVPLTARHFWITLGVKASQNRSMSEIVILTAFWLFLWFWIFIHETNHQFGLAAKLVERIIMKYLIR